MGRPLRASVGGYLYHALNRGNGRGTIFHKDEDYAAFERVLCEAQEHVPGVRLLAYCLMPNHWHLVLWPKADGELSDLLHWLTLTHTQRWHVHYGKVGGGHLYQGRFKSFPMQDDEHFLAVCRYVERNALRAGLVKRAEDWRWGSLSRRLAADDPQRPILSSGPLPWPADWVKLVNRVQTEGELAAIRRCAERGQPYGGAIWTKRTAGRLGLASTLRQRGRPKKQSEKGS
jgi:putative transposase